MARNNQYGTRPREVKQEQSAMDAWTEDEHDHEVGDAPVGQIQIDVVQEVGEGSQQRVKEEVGQGEYGEDPRLQVEGGEYFETEQELKEEPLEEEDQIDELEYEPEEGDQIDEHEYVEEPEEDRQAFEKRIKRKYKNKYKKQMVQNMAVVATLAVGIHKVVKGYKNSSKSKKHKKKK